MARTLYSPRLSDDVVRSLYQEAKKRGLPMTRLADLLLRQALFEATNSPPGYQQVPDATRFRVVA